MLRHSTANVKHWVAQTSLEQCLWLETDSSLWWWRNHTWRASIGKETFATAASAISHRWRSYDTMSLAHVLPSWLSTKCPVLDASQPLLSWVAVPCPRRAQGLEWWFPRGEAGAAGKRRPAARRHVACCQVAAGNLPLQISFLLSASAGEDAHLEDFNLDADRFSHTHPPPFNLEIKLNVDVTASQAGFWLGNESFGAVLVSECSCVWSSPALHRGPC